MANSRVYEYQYGNPQKHNDEISEKFNKGEVDRTIPTRNEDRYNFDDHSDSEILGKNGKN